MLRSVVKVCGIVRKGVGGKELLRLSKAVQNAISVKKTAYKSFLDQVSDEQPTV